RTRSENAWTRSTREADADRGRGSGDGSPGTVDGRLVAAREGARTRGSAEAVARIVHDRRRARGSIRANGHHERDDGLVDLIVVGLGREGTVPRRPASKRRRARQIGFRWTCGGRP